MQLRLACVHPQLTMYWMQLSNELQLNQVREGHSLVLIRGMKSYREEHCMVMYVSN